ncbi:MAG: orotidine 5'-phosphate decarboxylase / HUMPS family protein, partial [Acidilobaceae archaeon]
GESLGYWLNIVSGLCGEAAGFKFGLPFLLSFGVDGVRVSRGLCGGMFVVDLKLADVGDVMVSSVSRLVGYVDGVIAHGFTGFEGALGELKEYLDGFGVKLILVVSMSHGGSLDVLDANIDRLLQVADRVRPWGLVAPATRPHVISYVRSRAPWAKIMAPGVGVQGARPGDALRAGADYEIIGRAITRAPNPLEVLRSINLEHSKITGG